MKNYLIPLISTVLFSCSSSVDRSEFNSSLDTVDSLAIEIAKVDDPAREFREDFLNYIKINTDYRADLALGGVYDGKVMLTNTSDFKIDYINLSAGYIKKNGQLHTSELLTFVNIAPGETKILSIPDRNRGVSIETSITEIYSHSARFKYVPGNWAKGEDPYYTAN